MVQYFQYFWMVEVVWYVVVFVEQFVQFGVVYQYVIFGGVWVGVYVGYGVVFVVLEGLVDFQWLGDQCVVGDFVENVVGVEGVVVVVYVGVVMVDDQV